MYLNMRRAIAVAITVVMILAAVSGIALSFSAQYDTVKPTGVLAAVENVSETKDADTVYFDFNKPSAMSLTSNYNGDALLNGTMFYVRIIVQDKLWPYRDNFEIQVWNENNDPYYIKIEKAGFYWKSGTYQDCVTLPLTEKTTKSWFGPYYSDQTNEQKWAADYVEINMTVMKGFKYAVINAKFYVGRTEVEYL